MRSSELKGAGIRVSATSARKVLLGQGLQPGTGTRRFHAARRREDHQFLIHDRDTKFSQASDELFRTEGIKIVRTPIQAPNANAYVERWVRTVRSDYLDRVLIIGRRQLEHILRVYRWHYNERRPCRTHQLLPLNGRDPTPRKTTARLRCRDV